MALRAEQGVPDLRVVSSFGIDQRYLGPSFPARQIMTSQRRRELQFKGDYYKCRQHDGKVFDWNGMMRRPGQQQATQPLIGGSMPEMFIPLNQRRPCSPYRLARSIVGAFTSFLFGHGRWPNVLSDDPDTQHFAEALVNEVKLRTKMIRARNSGGACGTVGLSWGFKEGKPRVRVHDASNLYVIEWEDEDELVPAHVVELYHYPQDVEIDGKLKRKFFWHRRDWTMNSNIEFVPIEVKNENPVWQIDEDRSVLHNYEECQFVWISNLPDDETTTIDGQPDYAEEYENMDDLDVLNSATSKGVKLNVDPTLVLKTDEEFDVIRKGSENALTVGPSGDAKYLELSGSSVTAGREMVAGKREQILESCQCVLPDPNEVVGTATSSVALKIVYAPMLSKVDIMREQYGDGILRLLEGMLKVARLEEPYTEVQVNEDGSPAVDDDGSPIEYEVQPTFNLPPRIEKEEVLDEDGVPNGEFVLKEIPVKPGTGRLKLEWPDYFKPTADDHQKDATAYSAMTGGKPSVSQQTAVEMMATKMQRDPQEEMARIRLEQQKQAQLEQSMFPGTGGEVDEEDALPEGAEEDEEEQGGEPRPDATAES